jgi:hypothetical protein
MTLSQLEQRLAAVERDLAQIKARQRPAHPVEMIDRIHGTMPDDAASREAARLGRKWRQSDLPKPRHRKAKRK